ncbi:MAG: VWA domain-containing protein [Fibrella sp.]|nr:VWA domain-containing protein [Armatimonadota bacterium]
MKNRLLTTFIVIAALGGLLAPRITLAQDTPSVDATLPSDAELGESATAVKSLRSVSPKTLVFVFDVSGSMRGELLRRAREATITVLREGTQSGDRVVLYTFGAGYDQVFDKTLKSEAEKRELIALVPTKPGDGAGTNIRKPHHDALKLLEANLPNPGAVILLTDSFNDEPKRDDAAYPTYLQYYVPGGRLAKHPDTPENRDYERLLRLMTDSQKVQIFGIGVQIDKSGRPVERLPQVEQTPAPATVGGDQTSTSVATVGGDKKSGFPLEWLIGGGLLALALIAGLVMFMRGSKPVPLRIKGGPGGLKDFEIVAGQNVYIGGANAHAFDAYALPGTANPVATLRGASGGRFTLAPMTQEGGASAVKVILNGLPLEKESPLTFGDEVRISVPEASGAMKEYRLIFDDPTKSF